MRSSPEAFRPGKPAAAEASSFGSRFVFLLHDHAAAGLGGFSSGAELIKYLNQVEVVS
jgi:hypothetical protein